MKPNLPRSVLAIVAGVVFAVSITLATDHVLHSSGIFPPIGQPMSDGLFGLATLYRTIYGVAGAWLIAWLAPRKPMLHAMISGVLGALVALVGTIATWNNDPAFGPHWYPIALVILALPQSWLGAKLHQWFTTNASDSVAISH
jgi:hypothetical protein